MHCLQATIVAHRHPWPAAFAVDARPDQQPDHPPALAAVGLEHIEHSRIVQRLAREGYSHDAREVVIAHRNGVRIAARTTLKTHHTDTAADTATHP